MSNKDAKVGGEFGLISELTSICSSSVAEGVVAAGDDCAVVPFAQGQLLVTTDSLVDGVHFRSSLIPFAKLGWKTLVVSLSDVAAMGGSPVGAVINLHLPQSISREQLKDLYLGLSMAADFYKCPILGGDTVSATEFSIVSTVFARTNSKPILRSGAFAGDDIWLSSIPGLAGEALGLESGLAGEYAELAESLQHKLDPLYLPTADIELGKWLVEQEVVSAAIDVSDGVLADAGHIATSSNVTIRLNLEVLRKIVAHDDARRLALALTAGEDYCLLFSSNAANREKLSRYQGSDGQRCFLVGEVAEEGTSRVELFDNEKNWSKQQYLEEFNIRAAGFDHFSE